MTQVTREPLGSGWRGVLILNWAATFAALLAVAVSSRTIGRPTWWLGPGADPSPVVLAAVPVVAVAVPLVAAVRRSSRAPVISVLGSAAVAAIGLGDLAGRPAIGTATLVVAGASMLASVGVATGARRYR